MPAPWYMPWDIYQERLAAFQLAYHTNTWEAYENEGAFALTV